MKYFTAKEEKQLRENGIKSDQGQEIDPKPVVKLFAINGAATWLISELSPFYEGMAFGLCDLGMGCPELGDVFLPELEAVKTKSGISAIEKDRYFRPDHPLSVFTEAARMCGRITEDVTELENAQIVLASRKLEQ